MDNKWIAIMFSVAFGSMFISIGYSESAKYQARTECLNSYATSDRSADEIRRICY